MNHLRRFSRHKVVHSAFLLAMAIQTGCNKEPLVTRSCSILSFDAQSNQYTMVYTQLVDGKPVTRRLAAQCASYQWGDREVLTGPEVCKLVVGRTLKENPILGKKFLTIYEVSSDKLAIMEGIGPNRVIQQFDILRQEVSHP